MGRPKGSKNKAKQEKLPEKLPEKAPKKGKTKVEAAVAEPKVEAAKPVEAPKAPEPEKPVREEFKPDPAAIAAYNKEVEEAMERFDKEVSADDPDLIAKWMSYFPSSKHFKDVNW